MASAELSRIETWSLLTLLVASIAVLTNTFQGDGAPVVASLAFSTLAFTATYAFIRWSGPSFVKAGLKGKDLSKLHAKEIPEGMGAIAAAIFILVLIAFIPFAFYKDIVHATSGGGNRDVVTSTTYSLFSNNDTLTAGRFLHRFPHAKLSSYQSALATLQTTTILGLADDILDLRWRHKFFIPAVASLPLLMVYYVDFGVTSVVVPNIARQFIPGRARLLNLGALYYVYMSALSIFAPNSINIFAGINGVEVGQSIVIAALLIVNSSLYLVPFPGNPVLDSSTGAFYDYKQGLYRHPATESHLLTLYILLPFMAVSIALYIHNRYPARVFVGDTYCYVAGMTFAVVAILSHFSKTLLLLLVPQILNFIYSLPQLFKVVPCPRHRLPKFNARTGLLEPSVTKWEEKQPKEWLRRVFEVMDKLGLIKIYYHGDGGTNGTIHAPVLTNGHIHGHTRGLSSSGSSTPTRSTTPQPVVSNSEKHHDRARKRITATSNFTIINLYLVHRGSIREDRLTQELLLLNLACGALGLFVRHKLAIFLFGMDNRPRDGIWGV